jgi:ribosomal protein L37AE/L43A
MPLKVLVEAAVEFVIEIVSDVVSDFVEQLFGNSFTLHSARRRFSKAYAQSFFCQQCPGTSKKPNVKQKWYIYQCQDCSSKWGVLKDKPWVRKVRRRRVNFQKQAI